MYAGVSVFLAIPQTVQKSACVSKVIPCPDIKAVFASKCVAALSGSRILNGWTFRD